MALMRVQVDFNDLNALVDDLTDVVYFSNHVHATFLALVSEGQRVLLYQDEDDFTVEGVVDRLHIRGRDLWYARPDWNTRQDLA